MGIDHGYMTIPAILRFSCLAITLVLVLASGPAFATDRPIQGGSGGAVFRDDCGRGRYLVGVSIRKGGWVDAILPLCAAYTAQKRFAKWERGRRHGGAGGSPLLKDAVCPADHFVIGLKFGVTQGKKRFIDWVAVQCIRIAGGTSFDICLHTGDGCPLHQAFEPFWQTCPYGEWATGLRGRIGIYVDALGLICGPEPN